MSADNHPDPAIALIAEEDRWRTLAVAARDKADGAWHALSDHHDINREDDERTRPLYVEAERLESIAGALFRQIVETRATTIEGVAAKVEFLFADPEPYIESVLADLRALAAGGAA